MSKIHALPLTGLLAALLAGSVTAQGKGKKPFDFKETVRPLVVRPCFDYTHIREPDAVWWERAHGAGIDIAEAMTRAKGEREDVRVAGARLVLGARDYYLVELWKLDSDEPEFVRLAAADGTPLSPEDVVPGEPCLDHGDAAGRPGRRKLFNAPVTATSAVDVAVGRFETPSRVVEVRFATKEKDRRYEMEVYQWYEPNSAAYRWYFVVPADKPVMRMRIAMDRYPGQPLRGAETTKLDNGVEIYDMEYGDGEVATADSVVTVNYRLVLLDNQIIYSSKSQRPKPKFKVSEAPLRGLALGIPGMRVGGLRKIVIPAELAYGKEGKGRIPRGATIVADVGLEKIH